MINYNSSSPKCPECLSASPLSRSSSLWQVGAWEMLLPLECCSTRHCYGSVHDPPLLLRFRGFFSGAILSSFMLPPTLELGTPFASIPTAIHLVQPLTPLAFYSELALFWEDKMFCLSGVGIEAECGCFPASPWPQWVFSSLPPLYGHSGGAMWAEATRSGQTGQSSAAR